MDFVSLQPGHYLNLAAEHQLSAAGPAPSVRSGLDSGQPVSGLPGKAIGQRWCAVDRPGNADQAGSDIENCDGSLNSPDDCFDAPGLSAPRQQTPESQESDGGGPWQVVTRRRSRSKQQLSSVVAPAGQRGARAKKGTRGKSASASQLPENSSAGNGVTGRNKRQQRPGNELGPLLSSTPRSYWPVCLRSFARLGEIEWAPFRACLMKFNQWLRINLSRNEFRRFHHMMTEGPQAIRGTDDALFLVAPFKVVLSECELSSDAILLSLIFERAVPGFLKMLGERFATGLARVNQKNGELFTAITELLVQICQEDERWLERLGWQHLYIRHQCNLFSSLSFFFKHGNEIELTRNLHRQVDGSWLEQQHNATVQKLSRDAMRGNPDTRLRDLKASVRAIMCWLEVRFSANPEAGEHYRLIVRYAGITENLIEVMDSLDLQLSSLLFGVWQAVAQFSVRFRVHLSAHLGFDRTIALLDRLLHYIRPWPVLDSLAFELRLTLLRAVLVKCEDLLYERDHNLFSQAWGQYENTVELHLAKCNQFMESYQPPFADFSQSLHDRNKEWARLELLLRESKFHRLGCEIRKSTRQEIQEKLEACREAFTRGWALSCNHLEVGIIELAKWCFLAGERDEAVTTLMGYQFKLARLSWKKADLLANHGIYHSAVDEFHHAKALITDPDEAGQRKRDQVDDRIAMTKLRWYQAEGNTEYLVSAYRLSVDLLGRCHIHDRACFEGGLAHIVNAMKNSGLRFVDFAGQTQALGYLVRDGCGIKSWHHFVDLLHIRHKLGLTDVNTVDKVAGEIARKHQFFLALGKKA